MIARPDPNGGECETSQVRQRDAGKCLNKVARPFFLALGLLIISAGHVGDVYTAEPALNAPRIKTKPVITKPFDPKNVPEGLYLICPIGRSISPLLLVQNGNLLDPYLFVHQSSIAALQKPFVHNQTFSAYVNNQKLRTLKDVRLEVFTPGLQGLLGDIIDNRDAGNQAICEGPPFPLEDHRVRHGNFPFIDREVRPVYTPEAYRPNPRAAAAQKHGGFRTVTDAELEKIEEAARTQLVPRYLTVLKQRLGEMYGGEGETSRTKSRSASATAMDIDGTGGQDIVGVYWVQAVEEVDPEASHRVNVVYRLRSDGKLEVITVTEESLGKLERRKPHDMIDLLGALDFDRDGALELVVSRMTETDECEIYHQSLEIYRKQGPEKRWQLIYATATNVRLMC